MQQSKAGCDTCNKQTKQAETRATKQTGGSTYQQPTKAGSDTCDTPYARSPRTYYSSSTWKENEGGGRVPRIPSLREIARLFPGAFPGALDNMGHPKLQEADS